MIENIKLQNFKSLVDLDLDLKSLNVLIGQNASGKSNFLSFFRLLREAAQERLNIGINSMGGIGNILHYSSNEIGDLWTWQFIFSKNYTQSYPIYKGDVYRSNSGYLISEEILGYQDAVKSEVTRIDFLASSESSYIADRGIKTYELAIAQIRDRFGYPLLAEIRTVLADWQIFHGFGEDALRNIRGPQLFNVIDPMRLDPSASNLISIIRQLANDPRYESIYDRLMEILQVIFPDIKKLDTPVSAGGTGSLTYRSKDFNVSIPALNMSDGQLRFLGLVIILLLADLPNPPSLIVIDEPEIGMHPKMIAVFAELLQAASEKTQIIVTTHSPQLIDKMKPEDVIVAEKEDGKTTLHRLNSESLNRWLERYTLGELWTMGKLKA